MTWRLGEGSRGKIAEHPWYYRGRRRDCLEYRRFDFVREEETAPNHHQSLWRHGRLNAIHGLFQVSPVSGSAEVTMLQHHIY